MAPSPPGAPPLAVHLREPLLLSSRNTCRVAAGIAADCCAASVAPPLATLSCTCMSPSRLSAQPVAVPPAPCSSDALLLNALLNKLSLSSRNTCTCRLSGWNNRRSLRCRCCTVAGDFQLLHVVVALAVLTVHAVSLILSLLDIAGANVASCLQPCQLLLHSASSQCFAHCVGFVQFVITNTHVVGQPCPVCIQAYASLFP